MIDVNKIGRTRQAHVKQRNQALPPRQHFCIVGMLFEQNERLVEYTWGAVLKTWWFHGSHLPR